MDYRAVSRESGRRAVRRTRCSPRIPQTPPGATPRWPPVPSRRVGRPWRCGTVRPTPRVPGRRTRPPPLPRAPSIDELSCVPASSHHRPQSAGANPNKARALGAGSAAALAGPTDRRIRPAFDDLRCSYRNLVPSNKVPVGIRDHGHDQRAYLAWRTEEQSRQAGHTVVERRSAFVRGLLQLAALTKAEHKALLTVVVSPNETLEGNCIPLSIQANRRTDSLSFCSLSISKRCRQHHSD